MSEIYTAHNLIRFIYQETSPIETANIQHLLHHNLQAKEEYESLKEMVGMLDELSLDAHPTSIQLVLEHAQKQAEAVS